MMKKLVSMLLFFLFIPLVKGVVVRGCTGLLSDREVYLIEDINFTGEHCFNVGLDNTLIDCLGHWIRGSGKPGSIAFFIATKNVTIRNCKISGFGSAFHLLGEDATIYNNYIESGIIYVPGKNNLIYNNYIGGGVMSFADAPNKWNVFLRKEKNIVGGEYVGGNYWPSYSQNCKDEDLNGICDEPYVMNKDNTDFHPLAIACKPSFRYSEWEDLGCVNSTHRKFVRTVSDMNKCRESFEEIKEVEDESCSPLPTGRATLPKLSFIPLVLIIVVGFILFFLFFRR